MGVSKDVNTSFTEILNSLSCAEKSFHYTSLLISCYHLMNTLNKNLMAILICSERTPTAEKYFLMMTANNSPNMFFLCFLSETA